MEGREGMNFGGASGSQTLGSRDAGGMTISRRPKRRASNAKAPGPSIAMDTAITIISSETNGPSNKVVAGAGTHEILLATHPRPAKILAMGVRNPIIRLTPLMARSTPKSSPPALNLAPLERYKNPCTIAARPTIARSKSNAAPGQLSGKVENSLSSAVTLVVQKTRNDQR